jgi:hypothetical protein
MSIQHAIAYCQTCDSHQAGVEAALGIRDRLGQRPDVLLLFTTIGHDAAQLVAGIASVMGDVPVVGCSQFGIITQQGCDESSHSIALLGLQSSDVEFYPFILDGLQVDSEAVGRDLGSKLAFWEQEKQDPNRLLMLFPDSMNGNVNALMRGVEASIGGAIDIVGGIAAHDYLATETFQFLNQRVTHQGVSGLFLTGDFQYRLEISHGSQPMGGVRTITKAVGNVVEEIDGRPAMELLNTLIGAERIQDYGQLVNLVTLGAAVEGDEETFIVRAIVNTNLEEGSFRLSSEIPTGGKFRITRRVPNQVLRSTEVATQALIDRMESPDQALYLYFNCDGRGSYLFGDVDPDVEAMQSVLGRDRDLFGCFCFGELAPVRGKNYCHGYTGVMLGLE